MPSRLVNVRLDPEHLRKVRRLRDRGIALSDLVRDAIDRAFDALAPGQGGVDAKALVNGLFERFPDPPDLEPRAYDVHDRRQAAAAVRERLSRRRT